jgi:hypothetical protein
MQFRWYVAKNTSCRGKEIEVLLGMFLWSVMYRIRREITLIIASGIMTLILCSVSFLLAYDGYIQYNSKSMSNMEVRCMLSSG